MSIYKYGAVKCCWDNPTYMFVIQLQVKQNSINYKNLKTSNWLKNFKKLFTNAHSVFKTWETRITCPQVMYTDRKWHLVKSAPVCVCVCVEQANRLCTNMHMHTEKEVHK